MRTAPLLTLTAALVAVGGAGLIVSARAVAATDPATLVNPLIGTSGLVHDFPGADMPFGMVQWSPDTTSRPAGGGYEYKDSAVTGFSVTHLSGPGCASAGDLPILPVAGAVPAGPGSATTPLTHSAETATPGQYDLVSAGVETDLTVTPRTGFGRFSFPAGSAATLLLKLNGSAAGTSYTSVTFVSPTEVQVTVRSGHFCGATNTYTVHADLLFDRPVQTSGTWSTNGTTTTVATGTVTGAAGTYLTFAAAGTASTVLQAKVGLSYVSSANAAANLQAEDPGWNFTATASAAHAAWSAQLSRIQVTGGTASEQTEFYTAMYHSLLHANICSDVNRQYLGADGKTHTAPTGHTEYTNFSGWDVYRSQIQLAAMVAPTIVSDQIRSMLDVYDQTGRLPKWLMNERETYVMVGDPADAIIADAYAFGATGFNTAHALTAMVAQATQTNNDRPGLAQYLSLGYLPSDATYGCCNAGTGTVSTQQEYDVADHAIASFAAALGDTSTAATFAARANNWQNVFNPATGYLEPRTGAGQFPASFSPASTTGFVQGDSYQYTPMEPYDVAGVVAAGGGSAAWVSRLNALTANVTATGATNANFGNEPSSEIPWEYDYVGAPYLTQATVRAVQQQVFSANPKSMTGNDDLGAMSSWYVFSALGFYPVTPGATTLALGSPVFSSATITLGNGATLQLNGSGAADNAPYVQSMTVNGAPWTHAYLPSSLLSAGGTVTTTLGTSPNTTFGSAPADAPTSDTSGLDPALGYTTTPVVSVAAGGAASVSLGLRALAAGQQQATVTVDSASTIGATPATTTLTASPGADQTTNFTVNAPAATGTYDLDLDLTVGSTTLPDVVVQIDVVPPGSLQLYATNAGLSTDGAVGQGNFDGSGWSYSQQALATAGMTFGSTVTAAGLTYQLPATTPGQQDNVVAAGQTITFAQPVMGGSLGILGASSGSASGATGTFVLTYTDGSTQPVGLTLSDWTLGGGKKTASAADTVVAATPYRDTTAGAKQSVTTYLFATSAPITASKAVQSVTLPAAISGTKLHLFALTVG